MKKTISLPTAIVIIVACIGLMGVIAWQYGLIPLQKNTEKPEPQMALAPYVDVEATVVSLFLDNLYSDCEEPEVCPRDRVTLVIDKIDRSGDPSNVINLDVGYEAEFHLEYSARLAKLRNDLPPTCPDGWIFKSGSCVREGCEGPGCTASSPQYGEKPAELENDYVVYHLPQQNDEVTEKILPGLERGSKIKIRIWQSALMRKEIGEYELI